MPAICCSSGGIALIASRGSHQNPVARAAQPSSKKIWLNPDSPFKASNGSDHRCPSVSDLFAANARFACGKLPIGRNRRHRQELIGGTLLPERASTSPSARLAAWLRQGASRSPIDEAPISFPRARTGSTALRIAAIYAPVSRRAAICFSRRRCTEDGMRSASQYLATVRRAMSIPSFCKASASASSDNTA